MKVYAVDQGAGVLQQFAHGIGAVVSGRFVHIPERLGGGYLTGFSWGTELRMMMRHYYLKEATLLEWTSTGDHGEVADELIVVLRGIFPSAALQPAQVRPEPASVFIGQRGVSLAIDMPANTLFNSVTIAVSRPYLRQLFGKLSHPLVAELLMANDSLAVEAVISPPMVSAASSLLQPVVPLELERSYYKLKCEELLCCTLALLMQREAVPVSRMHLTDLKALYVIKQHLQSAFNQPPAIAALARAAGMSEPKLRKLFKQTFGLGVFEYYQTMRMQEAARLLKEQQLTVAEVGYQVGFTNLSHFARVFEEHLGMTPKKYSAA